MSGMILTAPAPRDFGAPIAAGLRFLAYPLAVGAVAATSLAFFFRHALLTGLTRLYGDSYDGLIEVAILEHWHRVLAHGAAWRVTGWFAPYPDTLGYNDTYVLPGLVFAAARSFGADPFLAAFTSHVAMKAIGFAGMLVLLRGLRLGRAAALFGAAWFTVTGATLAQANHGQLLSLALVPWLGRCAVAAGDAVARADRRRLFGSGAAAALCFALLALNAFYFAFFGMLFAGLSARLAWWLAPAERRQAWRIGARALRAPLLMLTGVQVALLAPFLAVYLPKLAEGGRHGWPMVLHLLPRPLTAIDVGDGNLVWGRAWAALRAALAPGDAITGEQEVGIPPCAWVVATLAGVWAWRRRGEGSADADAARRTLALGGAALLLLLLSVRVGNASLWAGVYLIVPGGGSVRTITRLYLLLLVPLTVIVATWLDRRGAARPRPELAALMALLIAEQVQTTPPLAVDRVAERAWLAGLPPPPAGCRAFFVVAARPGVELGGATPGRGRAQYDWYRHNVDAMLLSAWWGVPTVNGISTFDPPDWNFAHPDAPDYLARVRGYARRHALSGLCGLDRRRTPSWYPLTA